MLASHPEATRAMRTVALAAALALGLAACGKDDGKKPATQVAAKVNKEEISVHQINFVLQRTPGITAERAPEAKKAILERLIEQEILVQAADGMKLDRDPDVLQQLEATRREVLARAYLQKVAAAVPRPDAKEVAEFFKAQPQLFQNRKVYRFNEIVLPSRPANWPELEKALAPVKTIQEAAAVLRERGIEAPIAQGSVRASEQIPLNIIADFDKLKEGDVAIYPQPPAMVIAQIVSIRPEPVDEKRAGPVIEQFLLNKKRGEAVQADVKRLREAAKVTYLGEFEGGAAKPAAAAQPAAGQPQAPAPAAPAPAPAAAPGGDGGVSQGIKGLK
jgi:EpsD family peptidyl-prolyl cis-trans isomerase